MEEGGRGVRQGQVEGVGVRQLFWRMWALRGGGGVGNLFGGWGARGGGGGVRGV